MKRHATLIALALLLSGCAFGSYGTHVSAEKQAKLYNGMTMAEVRALCGNPQADVPVYGGQRQWTYSSHSSALIPGLSQGSSSMLTLVFEKGKLVDAPGGDRPTEEPEQ